MDFLCLFETGCLHVVKAISSFCCSWVSFPSTGTVLWMAGTYMRKHCHCELGIVLGNKTRLLSFMAHRMQFGDAVDPETSFVNLQNGAMQLMHKGRELKEMPD